MINPRTPVTPEAMTFIDKLYQQRGAFGSARWRREQAEKVVAEQEERMASAQGALVKLRDEVAKRKADEDEQRVKLEEMLAKCASKLN